MEFVCVSICHPGEHISAGVNQILRLLVKVAVRTPKLAVAVSILALVALASTMTYAGYLVVGVISDYLGSNRFIAGLLLGILFARMPYVRQGKLRTIGLLPKNARLPTLVALLAFCLLSFLYRGEMVPMLFLGLAATFLLTIRWLRRTFMNRFASFFTSSLDPAHSRNTDTTIIDAEFREKKD
jgi:hypothetical protein